MNYDLKKYGINRKTGMVIFSSGALSGIIGAIIGVVSTIIFDINNSLFVCIWVTIFGEIMGITLICRFYFGAKSFLLGIIGGIIGGGFGSIVFLIAPIGLIGLVLAVCLIVMFLFTIILIWFIKDNIDIDEMLLKIRWDDIK
jgi:hypothetical protein